MGATMGKGFRLSTFFRSSPAAALIRLVMSLFGHGGTARRGVSGTSVRHRMPASTYASGPNGISDDLYVLPPAFARYLRRNR